jgi:uncharacterized membrane protein
MHDGKRSSPELAGVVRRNILALVEARREISARRPATVRAADRITAFVGSIGFVVLHAVAVAVWIIVNLGVVPGVRPFDPFPFVMLAMIASVEAIFLSTFVLISQNRMQAMADQRADLDLQISLLSEHEITRLVQLSHAIAERMGVSLHDPSLEELKRDVPPEAVLREIDAIEQEQDGRAPAT